MYELPTTLNIGGIDYKIRGDGDYRIVLDTFSVLEDIELEKQYRVMLALCVFYDGIDSVDDLKQFSDLEEAANKMFEFFSAGRPSDNKPSRMKLIDWEGDSAMICAAVNKVAGIEVRAIKYMHWWTFMSYYMSVGESTLSTVVDIRDKIVRNKKLEKWENKFRSENPQYFTWNSKTAEDIEAENWVLSQWNSED